MSITKAYDLTAKETAALRWALLYVRSHSPESVVELTVDQIVELENKLLWPEPAIG